MIPQDELVRRIRHFQDRMQKRQVAGALLLQRADLYYFSGTGQNAHLFIPASGEPTLIVKKSLTRARQESALDKIVAFEGWDRLKTLVSSSAEDGSKIGLETDVLPANLYLRYKKLFEEFLIEDVSGDIRSIRAVKSPYEIGQMREAAKISESVFNQVPNVLREGITETDLAGQLELHARSLGHQGMVRMRGFNQEMYFGHILAGENAAAVSFFDGPTGGSGLNPSFPQGAGNHIIKRKEPVLVDFVVVWNGYMVDQTRVFCLGEPSFHLAEAYRQSVKINHLLAATGKPGLAAEKLFSIAQEKAAEAGLSNHFMGYVEKVNFVGHGVGLELDEMPVIARGADLPLEEGMVFTLEPKFVFPGEATVGIEDTYAVGCAKLEPLTSFSEELQVL